MPRRESSLTDLFPPFDGTTAKATKPNGPQEVLSTPHFAQNALCETHVRLLHKTEAWSFNEAELLHEKPDANAHHKKVHYFLIEVRIGASAFVVRRRYKDFDKLHSDLCSTYGKSAVPELPPKQLFKNEDAEFVRRRQAQLATYLDALSADKVLSMSAELCAFLECESGSQLAATNSALSAHTATLMSELTDAERLCDARTAELEARKAELEAAAKEVAELRGSLATLRADLGATRTERDAAKSERDRFRNGRDVALQERDAARGEAKAGRERVLAMLLRAREGRQVESALKMWAAQRLHKAPPKVANAFSAAISAAISGLKSSPGGGVPIADVSAINSNSNNEAAAEGTNAAAVAIAAPQVTATPMPSAAPAAVAPPPMMSSSELLPPSAAPTEIAVQTGLLLKQGAGNKAFQERYFELVTLGEAAQYGSFLVYYESEAKAAVKGYICLEGATVTQLHEHPMEPYCLTLTTPAKRLSVLQPTDGNDGSQKRASQAGGGGGGGGGVAAGGGKRSSRYELPPSVDAKMNILQKLDNWGKQALRNAMAQGPVTTWTLAATSKAELDEWMNGFTTVLGGVATATAHEGGAAAIPQTPVQQPVAAM